MKRVVLVIGFVGAALSAQEAPPQEPQTPPTFRGGARFVRVDVYPTDADGRPVEGLTAADFEVYEDGQPQEIDSFEFVQIEPEPEIARVDPESQSEGEALAKDPRARVFGIVLDTGHVGVGGSHELKAPLVGMLDRLIGPRDLFGVITTELPPASFLLGRKTTTVADMMGKYWTWGTYDQISPQDAVEDLFDSCFGSVTGGSQSLTGTATSNYTRELVARHRERQTLEFLDKLVDKMAGIREERKFLIVVTQGWRLFGPNERMLEEIVAGMRGGVPQPIVERGRITLGAPPEGQNPNNVRNRTDCSSEAAGLLLMDSRPAHRALMEKAQRANVAFYPIDPRGLTPFDQPISHGVISVAEEAKRVTARLEGLRELAINTDGRAFVQSNDMDEQFQQLAANLSTYYLLGYYSTNTTFDGKYRKLTVKVKKPGVRLTARRGYFAPTEEEIAAIAEGRVPVARSEADAAHIDALGRLADLVPHRALFVQAARVDGAVVVSAELGVQARTSEAWADGGEMTVTVEAAGAETVETRTVAPLRSGVSLRVPVVGPGDVRVAVKARSKTPGDFGAVDARIDVPAPKPSLIGGILSYRGIARALQPAADGRYRRTERVTLEAPLAAGAEPAGARVLDRAGTALSVPVASRVRVGEGGVRWLVASLPLAPFTDGDYVIEMEAVKGEARERRLFAIRVVR